ncbi:MAG TPA: NHL repeat-containing protein [Chthoniobacterales bacterium]|nr:NHL repeat-containing protein [Chthoniobacterales bacterium]
MKITLAVLAALCAFAAGVAADTFFVANTGGNTITSYDNNGNATLFATSGLNGPIGIAIDRGGNLFISTNSNTIEKFSALGVHLGTFANIGLNNPLGLAFDQEGNLYAANFAGSTVEKFSPDGTGTLFATVTRPTGLAFDSLGNLYVANFGNTIERFSPEGADLGTFANSGLNNPEGLAFDSLGNLYAANNATGTVEEFSPAGADLGVFAVGLGGPVGLAFDSAQSLYVVDAQSATITRIDETGATTLFANTGFNPAFIAVQKPPQLANISTRGRVLTGENVLDAGFIVTGPGSKQVLIRGLGPSLTSAGVPGALANPMLELHDSTGAVLAVNDNWKQTQESDIEATGLAPAFDVESAILVTLNAGSYTVIERGVGGTGVGLVEIYDLATGFGPELGNISTRDFVDTGSNVMIAGFIVSGTGATSSVLVRGLGPSLGKYGVSNPLADPTLDLHDGNGNVIASDDNWASTQAAQIRATGLAPEDPAEAAILIALSPGNYTAIESGKNGGTGVGLIEVYNQH